MFQFDQVVPQPLQGQIRNSDLWQCGQRIEAGKRYFVLAPSGSGKTTLQHILYGIRHDYSGSVRVQGACAEAETPRAERDLRRCSPAHWAYLRQRRLAAVFQDLRLFPALSALDNIQLKNQLTGFKTPEQISDMAERLGVGAFLGKRCGELSYGQRQRVAIVRALCQPFELLLLDEPFSHLDQDNVLKACRLIEQECRAQGAGYLLASLGERYALDYDAEWQL